MIALDTNVLIYACDKSDRRKQQIALDLIAASTDGVLLWQVACEFVAASRKLKEQGFTPSDSWDRLSEFIELFALTTPAADSLTLAREFHLTDGVAFWDSLIVAGCLTEGISTLYSEDIPSRDSFGQLRIINPFV